MATNKKKILVVDMGCSETEIFNSMHEAEVYINDGIEEGCSLEDFTAYEIVKQLGIEEETKVTLSEDEC